MPVYLLATVCLYLKYYFLVIHTPGTRSINVTSQSYILLGQHYFPKLSLMIIKIPMDMCSDLRITTDCSSSN